jgi:PKD repeat protein
VSWDIASLDAGAIITGWITGSLTCEAGVEVVNLEYGVTQSAQGVTVDGAPVGFTTLAPDIQASFQASAVAVKPGTPVEFTAEATTDGTALSYAWDFGDEATGSGSTVEHAYAAPGSYLVELLVTDECGFTASYTLTVLVNPSAVYLPLLPQMYTTGP